MLVATIFRPITVTNLLLGAYVLLAAGMEDNRGAFSPLALAFVLASYVCFLAATFRLAQRPERSTFPSDGGLAAAVALAALLSSRKPAGLWLQKLEYARWAEVTQLLVGVLVLSAFVIFPPKPALKLAVFAGGALAALALRMAMLWASPAPSIDVFELAQQESAYLLRGNNPYATPFWAPSQEGRPYTFDGYAYPPANLLLQAFAFALTKDSRWASVVLDLVFVVSLWLFTRRFAATTRQLLILLYLFHPTALFVLENAWTEPLTLGLLSLSFWLFQNGRSRTAAALAGFMLTMKHYLVFVAPLYLLLERRLKVWLVLAGVALVTVLPFVIWDPGSFWKNGVMLVVSLPFSDQTLSIAAPLHFWFGSTPGPALSVGTGLIGGALFPWLLRRAPLAERFTLAFAGTVFTMFLFGAKAFCNYYHLVSGVLLMALAVHAGRQEGIGGAEDANGVGSKKEPARRSLPMALLPE